MSEICTVIQGQDRKEIPVRSEVATLAQLLFLNGFFSGVPLCSGAGTCGHCRVRFVDHPPPQSIADRGVFSRAEIDAGWRLACRHPPKGGCVVDVPEYPEETRAALRCDSSKKRMLAVDVGTTLIKWALCTQEGPGLIRSAPNPQMGAGSEIMARIAFEEQVRPGFLGELIQRFVRELGPGPKDSLVITGNAVMVALLLGRSVQGLARAPYTLAYAGGRYEKIAADLPSAYIPPLLGPFLGADVSAGLAHVMQGMDSAPRFPFLYADLGTNGEFALAVDEETILLASVPMGPALEGVGLRFGAPAGDGVITAFDLSPQGLEPSGPGEGPFRAIAGTGYLSLLAVLKRVGVLDSRGRFFFPETPLAARILGGIKAGPAGRIPLSSGMALDGEDVEEVLKVKAAWNLAVSTLTRQSGVPFSGLGKVFLAGSFGAHVRGEDLEELGFLPGGGREKLCCVGDAALKGGCLLLEDPGVRRWCEALPGRSRLIELSRGETSGRDLVERMCFSYVP
jgi:uncharacterized 2Fe-2S/4Fe-4S cluster protein (DUF4445 family)